MRIADVTSEEFVRAVLLPHEQTVDSSPRASGAHVSDIIRDLENTLLKPGQRKKYDNLTDAEKRAMGERTQVGWAWEEILTWALKRTRPLATNVIRVGQLEADGITGTLDGYNVDHDAVEEYKATWRSMNRPLDPDFWHWLVQIKSYMRLSNTDTAFLRVLFVNGDYRESGPTTKVFHLTATAQEVKENWQMLVQHKIAMEKRESCQKRTRTRGSRE